MKYNPLSEITLRKYEKPFRLEGRELIKKLCLSIGLLQPGDSRDVIVDIMYTVLKSKTPLTAKDIEERTKNIREINNLDMTGVKSSNIRRQIKRLKDMMLIEKHGQKYRISEDAPMTEVFKEKIEKYYLASIVSRVQEYFEAAEEVRK